MGTDLSWMIGLSFVDVTLSDGQTWFFDLGSGLMMQADSPWRIITEGRITLTSEDHGQWYGHEAPIHADIRCKALLDGLKIQMAEIKEDTLDLMIVFDLGLRLEILPISSGYESWQISLPSNKSLIAQGGGNLTLWPLDNPISNSAQCVTTSTSGEVKTVMKFHSGIIPDVLLKPLSYYHDQRGWLCELFRHDEVPQEFWPVMAYISMTQPDIARGPHEHVYQADYFCFIGPSDFKLYLWDNRPQSPTYRTMQVEVVGQSRPMAVVVPPGVVHGYKNVGDVQGIVFNGANQLYKGQGRKEPVDEIRHESDVKSVFIME